jgi:cholesterol transport system auxiliary component
MTGTGASTIRRTLILGLALAVVAGALAGCINLFPTEKPAQLYRFSYTSAAAAPAPSPAGAPFTVRAIMANFSPGASGDRILTVRGETVAHISGGRWVETANSLMEEALHAAFAGRGPASVFAKGELGPTDYRLTLAVPVFEARYLGGPTEAPTVVVEMAASLSRLGDSSARRERVFRAEARADSNTIGAIVAAFDTAVTQVLDQLVTWTNAKGAT